MVTIKIVCLSCSTEIYRKIECGAIRIDQTSSLGRLRNDSIVKWLEPNGAWKGLFSEIYRVVGDRIMDIAVAGNRDVAEALSIAAQKVNDRYTINVKYEEAAPKKDVQKNNPDSDIENKANETNETLLFIDQEFAKYYIIFKDMFRIFTYISENGEKLKFDFRQIQNEAVMIDREIAKLKHISPNDTEKQIITDLYQRVQKHINMVIHETTTILSSVYHQMDDINNHTAWKEQYSSLEMDKNNLSMISLIEPDWKYIDSIAKEFDDFWERMKVHHPSQAVAKDICGRKGFCLTKPLAIEYGKTIHHDAEEYLKKCMSNISSIIYDSVGAPVYKIIHGNISNSYNKLFDAEIAELKKITNPQEIPSDNVTYDNNVITSYEAKDSRAYEFIEYIFVEDVLTNQRVWFMQYMDKWQQDTIEKAKHIIYKCKAQAERQVKIINGKLSVLRRREQEYRKNKDNTLKKINEIKQKQNLLKKIMESMLKRGA